MQKYLYIFCILLIGLTGCRQTQPQSLATEENYKSLLNGWLGRDKESLYQVWGTPMNDYWKNGVNYIVYMKQSVENTADGATIDRMPRVAAERAFYQKPQGLVTRSCTTLFKIEDHVISSWRFEGNNCVALP